MSIKEIQQLANINNNETIYYDCKRYCKERFIYTQLEALDLSEEGKLILKTARDLVRESFKYRDEFNKVHPTYNINTCDAG